MVKLRGLSRVRIVVWGEHPSLLKREELLVSSALLPGKHAASPGSEVFPHLLFHFIETLFKL